MNLHILGAKSPISLSIIEQYNKLDDDYNFSAEFNRVFLYSRNQSTEFLALDELSNNVREGDVIISLIPIFVAASLLARIDIAHLPKHIIAVSSSSVYSKIYSSSADHRSYLPFAIGELKLHEIFDHLDPHVHLCILRPTMIWGYGADKNISNIINFINSTGFYPLCRNGEGMRSPIHFDELATVIIYVLRKSLKGTYFVRTTNQLRFIQILEAVMALTRKRHPFLLRVSPAIAHFCANFSNYLASPSISLAFNSIMRQGDDLASFPEARNVIIHDSTSHCFLERLKSTYVSNSGN